MRAYSPERGFFPNWGDPNIRVAVLDGPADLEHPCFRGANVTLLPSPTSPGQRSTAGMVAHGTHIASVLFGQHGSEVEGIVPGCTGFVIPIFFNEAYSVSQLDLARAIELAVEKGAHVINISGGQLTDFGEADVWLHNAIRLCRARNVLVVAAAGNDGCDCLHVPASLPNVLAVGALDRHDRPMDFSNWGEAYRTAGVMAPGEKILGAKPGGGTTRANGTSFATPLVSGASALLLSLQASHGRAPDPLGIRQLLLDTALSCEGTGVEDADRCLAGKLNLPAAFDILTGSKDMTYQSMAKGNAINPQCACEDGDQSKQQPNAAVEPQMELQSAEPQLSVVPAGQAAAEPLRGGNQFSEQVSRQDGGGSGSLGASQVQAARPTESARPRMITPSQSPDEVEAAQGKVFALGVLGYDFGTEARRDTFKQLMPAYNEYPANPYDARQMVAYLKTNLAEARSLIWTLNIELTPVYAIEPVGAFARDVYDVLGSMLDGETLMETDPSYIQRVSIPGLLSGRTTRLFSGQVVPIIEPQNTRGLFGWMTNKLVERALSVSAAAGAPEDQGKVSVMLEGFLNRVYYDMRNLGKTSRDRALNFAVTNAFQSARTFSDPLIVGMQLDEISVDKSPFCRMDSDCWDVKLKFFDPDNVNRAKRIYRYTVDVSDLIPVTMGDVRTWTSPT